MNEETVVKKKKGVKVSVTVILCILFSIVFGIGGYFLGTKMTLKEDNSTGNNDHNANTEVNPDMNSNYTFLNSLKKEKDGINVIYYYYLDKETLNTYDVDDETEIKKDFYVLRGETFVNNKRLGDIYILDVLDEKVDNVTDKHFSVHEINSVSDTKNKDKYYFITIENNNTLVVDGIKIDPYSEVPTYIDIEARRTYLVNKDGNILKDFKYDSCWLSGIALNDVLEEDRYYIETDYSIFDESINDYVDINGKVIYPDGRYFDIHDNYFYWLDRLNGKNIEYKMYIEDGKLIEKEIRRYNELDVEIMDVNCI